MDRELAADAKRLADSVDRLREGSVRAASDAKMPQAERDAADRSMRELKRAAEQLESNLKDHRAVASDAASVLDLSNKALSFAQGVGPMRNEATTAMNVVRSATDAIALAFKP
jgi:glutathione S-transferase